MPKEDLALNNLQWLICHKTQPNQIIRIVVIVITLTFWSFSCVFCSGEPRFRQRIKNYIYSGLVEKTDT